MSSHLKFSPNLLMGSKELYRLQETQREIYTYLFSDAAAFGLYDRSYPFTNGLVAQGVNVGTIKHNDILAVTNGMRMIVKPATDNIPVPNDNTWYWVKIAHQYSPIETGTVSIDVQGNLTGSGTRFTALLRGQSQAPSRIRFYGSSNNIYEYDVQEVISDTQAVLVGDFIAETGLQYSIIGTFSPDAVPAESDKEIYNLNSCVFSLVAETTLNTRPSYVPDAEFFLARIKRNGSSLVIEDKRALNIYRSKTDADVYTVTQQENPLIGVESIRWDGPNTPRDQNVVQMGFTFRSTNWTIDPSVNRVTIITGNGGRFKSTVNFANGNFDGWRCYTKNGQFHRIISSTYSGGQINLTLDTLEADRFIDTAQTLIIAPDAEEIELIFYPNPGDSYNYEKKFSFPINSPFVQCPLVVYKSPSCTYNVRYRYKSLKTWGPEVVIPGSTIGFVPESAFNSNGTQVVIPSYVPYTSHPTNGFVTLTMAPNAYATRVSNVETGDKFGVDYFQLDNAAPVKTLRVGEHTSNQILFQDTPGYSLTVNHYVDLRGDVSGMRNGNRFSFRFLPGVYYQNTQSFNLYFVQNYVNSGDVGTILYRVTPSDFANIYNGSLTLDFIWDGTKWVLDGVGKLLGVSNGLVASGDLNDITLTGHYYADTGVLNKPSTYNGWLFVQGWNTGYCTQMYMDYNDNRLYTRRQNNGAWSAWTEHLIKTTADSIYATKAQAGWQNMTLLAGWSTWAGDTPQYRIDQFGMVHLRGTIAATAANWQFCSTLPVKSGGDGNYPKPYAAGGGGNFLGYCHILITGANGYVNKAPQWSNASNISALVSLTGVSYWQT